MPSAFTLVVIVAPEHYSVGSKTFGIGMGVTAYTHAFDADHIAAIDNTTRKLMGEGQRPLSEVDDRLNRARHALRATGCPPRAARRLR